MKSYVNKLKGNLSISTIKKTSNMLDGSYRSMFKGKSMNFDDLREYIPGDNIKDIDWKASARSRNLLVKQFVAEKKHNILLVIDANRKMLGFTPSDEIKKEVALMTAGTIGYIGIKNSDLVSAAFVENEKISFSPFKGRIENLEIMLAKCDKAIENKNESNLNTLLEYIRKNIPNRMIIFIITDIDGLDIIDEKYLKEISLRNDIKILNINDAYLYGEDIFNIETNKKIPSFFAKNKKLFEEEKLMREQLLNEMVSKYRHHKIPIQTIDNIKEIPFKIIKLLEDSKHEH